MLDNHGIGSHLDHEVARVSDPRGRDVKLVRAMKQYNEVIEIIPLAVQVLT